MRLSQNPLVLIGLIATLLLAAPLPSQAEPLQAFKTRIESAYRAPEKTVAVLQLIYQQNLNPEMRAMARQMVKHMIPQQPTVVTFLPPPDAAQLVAVVDGYEYRPNLEIVGFVDIGKNGMGGTTQVPYGIGPDGLYYFTATTKILVNPAAEADKQLQIIAIGLGHPAITFSGWCDILLSDNKTLRKPFSDQGVGNQTLILRGQLFEGCELTNTSNHGQLSLRLIVGQETIFEQHAETPQVTIRYLP